MTDRLLGILDFPPDPLRYQYSEQDSDSVTGALPTLIPPGSRVLKVGCGLGAMLQFFNKIPGVTTVGIEPNADRAAAAQSNGFDVRCIFLTEATAVSLGTFDVIVFADVLEHLFDPGDLLVIARSMLRPGGFVLASIPNVGHWTIRRSVLRGRFDYAPFGLMDATHIRWFTAASVQRLFTAAGYSRIDLSWTTGHHLAEYAWIPKRQGVLRKLVDLCPGVFGFQHIVKATPESGA